MAVTMANIIEARKRIQNVIYRTALMETTSLSLLTGLHVKLKSENLQKTGSFKIRGASNRIALLTPEEKARGVITASAGNHAQGVAYAAQQAGIESTIVMPSTTSIAKVEAVRRYKTRIILEGQTYDEAAERARAIQRETVATFVHAFDDYDVIAGQGTIGVEILEEWPEVDTVLVSIGGGGLISGIATAIKETKPQVRIVGVQASGAPSAKLALERGQPAKLSAAHTLADGIAVKQVGELTFPIIKNLVDEIVTVDEDEIAAAVLHLLEKSKVVIEGAGAAPVAALMYRRGIAKRSNVVVVLSGGNIDVNMLGKIIDSGLAKSGRFMTVEVVLEDVPGSLQRLLKHIADLEGNVLTIEHNRTSAKAPFGKTFVTLHLETRGYEHVEEIARELRKHYEVQPKP
ncbi:MAG: threonine ammonia-lyase [Candidatus Lindowbacteria bacterium]|nr:threonine ammonia-lyase [Candidatus Lindowbacteria bacterium]